MLNKSIIIHVQISVVLVNYNYMYMCITKPLLVRHYDFHLTKL